jgi:hypothetical protein
MRKRVLEHDVSFWARNFLGTLTGAPAGALTEVPS